MEPGPLLNLIARINRLIDKGKGGDINRLHIREHINQRDLIEWLDRKFGDNIDLSFFLPIEDFGAPENARDRTEATQCIQSQIRMSQFSKKNKEDLIDGLERY